MEKQRSSTLESKKEINCNIEWNDAPRRRKEEVLALLEGEGL
jgi:hypothetical protein